MKNNIIASIGIFLLLSACGRVDNPAQDRQIKQFDLKIKNTVDVTAWNDFITNIEFIPLETSANAIVDEIDKIIIRCNRIIIKSRKKGIFIFDLKGRLINNICKSGKAPFNVNHLFDFSVSQDGTIYVLDTGKLLTFDINGNPLDEIFFSFDKNEIGQEMNICAYNADTIYFWHASRGLKQKYHLSRSDIHGTIKELRVPYTHFSFGTEERFVQCGGNEWAITPGDLNDTIFAIENGKIELKFILDIKNNNKNIHPLIAKNDEEYATSNQLNNYLIQNDLYKLSGDIVFNSNYLFINIHNLNRGFFTRCMININTGFSQYFDYPFEADNLFHPRKLYMSQDNRFISSLAAYQVNKLIDDGKTAAPFLKEKRRLGLIDKLKNVKETDNPVLMIITTKDQTNEK